MRGHAAPELFLSLDRLPKTAGRESSDLPEEVPDVRQLRDDNSFELLATTVSGTGAPDVAQGLQATTLPDCALTRVRY